MDIRNLKRGDIVARRWDGYPLHVIGLANGGVFCKWINQDGFTRRAVFDAPQLRPWEGIRSVGSFIPPVREVMPA